MQHAIFTLFWCGTFRPILIDNGADLLLDTGVIHDQYGWHRCLSRFSFDGQTVTMERIIDGEDAGTAIHSCGIWTCRVQNLQADRRELEGITILTPAWVESKPASIVDLIAGAAGY